MRANAAWTKTGNGSRHCTPYDSSLAGASYICKGLEMPDLGGLSYEICKTELIDSGCLMVDDNTTAELWRLMRNGHRNSVASPSTGQLAGGGC